MTRVLHILPHPGGGGERLIDVLERVGGEYEHRRVYLTRSRSPGPALVSILRGRRQLAREVDRADLLHVMGDASACLTVRLLGRRPAVLGTHGLHLLRRARGLPGRLVRAALRRAVDAAAVTICSSAPELGELRALCSERQAPKLRLLPNGIELPQAVDPGERRSVRRELGIPDGAFVVLYAGQLERRKRPLDAVHAVRALERDCVLLVAGEGPLRDELERVAGPTVRVLGARSDVHRLMSAADAFVMPSEREGLSLAVLEAMGCGLAVVVSDGAGNPETVGEAGIVVPLGQVDALTRALETLALSPDLRHSLGSAARDRVREHF